MVETVLTDLSASMFNSHEFDQVKAEREQYEIILKEDPKNPQVNHKFGQLLASQGRTDCALPYFNIALNGAPEVDQFWLSPLYALLKLDRVQEASNLFLQAKKIGVKGKRFDDLQTKINAISKLHPPVSDTTLLLNIFMEGLLEQAERKSIELLKKFPLSTVVMNILGASLVKLEKNIEAVEIYKKLSHLKPENAEIFYNYGISLCRLDKLNEALAAFSKAISIRPEYPEAYNNIGKVLYSNGQIDLSSSFFQHAVKINPEYAEAHYNMGNIHLRRGDNAGAISSFNFAVKYQKEYAEAYNNLGSAYREHGFSHKALTCFEKAAELRPRSVEVFNNLGICYRDLGLLDLAKESFEKAILINPNSGETHRYLSSITTYKTEDPHVRKMLDILQSSVCSNTTCEINFALSKVYSDLKDVSTSFGYLSSGNAIRKKLLRYDIQQDRILFNKIRETNFKFKSFKLQPEESESDTVPIFILGMPRSGTTLVEQIISAHGSVHGAGELEYLRILGGGIVIGTDMFSEQNLLNFRSEYLKKLKSVSNNHRLVTDKMPANFRFINIILTALPESKIIHVHRNPQATCWSNFKHFFPANAHGYCYDLSDLCEYYSMYNELIKFWEINYPGLMYHLDYEKLVKNPEVEIKKVLHFLDIDEENACFFPQRNTRSTRTASQQQVRSSIYSGSSHKWKLYKEFLPKEFLKMQVNA